MTKVSFFIHSMNGAGAQRVMVRLATGFAEAGFAVEVLTLQSEGSFREELSPKVKLTTLSPKRILSAVPALVRHLRREPPFAMLVTEPASNVAVVVAKLISRSPSRILIRESCYPSVTVKGSSFKSTRVAYRLAPFFYRYADIIVAIASDMTADLSRFARLDRDRITTIPLNPVVTPMLQECAAEKPDHPWFDGETPVVLGVGRLDWQKDFMTLLRAFERLRGSRSCRLLILGDGPLRPGLEAARAKSAYASDIDMPGFVGRPFSYMAHCDAFVLPSRYEGQPNVLIEALACGAPVVATECPSGPREVLADGKYGRLVPVGDVDAMAAAISATLDAPIDKLQSTARGCEFTLSNSTALYVKALSG